jgi:hypothetical protein
LKRGEYTSQIASITEDHKKLMLKDYPEKFEVVKADKDSELAIENKEAKLTVTRKSKV